MANSTRRKRTGSITCPHCGAASGGSFSTVVKGDETGPIEVLHKCNSCGKFYTVERVISWHVKKA